MTPWLTIIGIGEDGWAGLSEPARRAIESADLLYGGSRHLAHVPALASHATPRAWPSPMAPAVSEILQQHRGQKRVTVLASGDPMLHGVGVTLTRELAPEEFHVIPQVSAFSLACARLGWSATETELVSLVSRPIEQMVRYLAPGRKLILYSEDGTTPATIARFLTTSGYGPSLLHVFENLGGHLEKHVAHLASTWTDTLCGNLNIVAFVCVAYDSTKPLSLAPGLPDDAFESDGQLTKREVRAATVARLAPLYGETLWDVGSGTGTIAIEWMRIHPSCYCVAFEAREDRAAHIRENAKRLGVPGLKVVLGTAPETFSGLPSPNAIFIGGGLGNDGLFEACWHHLLHGGRIVANAVTVESEALLASLHALHGGELIRIQVARAEVIGGSHAWRQMMPITQWTVTKR
jgi:precorrin-6Y C5,15-methyltransferase (decarboxylating)